MATMDQFFLSGYLCVPKTLEECDINCEYMKDIVDKYERHNNRCMCKELIHIADWHNAENKLERNNLFLNNLATMESFQNMAKQRRSIRFRNLILHDWEPFLQILQEKCNNNNNICIHIGQCLVTERAALALGNLLSKTTNQPNLNITGFCMAAQGSKAWMNGLLQNKTIQYLVIARIPFLRSAIHFIRNSPQLKEATLYALTTEQQQQTTICHQSSLAKLNSLESLEIIFHQNETYPLSLCQDIGSLLRQANNLRTLTLENLTERDLSHDFLKDAIHCDKLILNDADYNPHTVASLINDGNRGLKHLRLSHPNDVSTLECFLHLVDLSLLDSFEIDSGSDRLNDYRYSESSCNVEYNDGLIDALSRHLAENKGPKRLHVYIYDASLDLFGSKFASGLVGNDKIRRLELYAKEVGNETAVGQQIINALTSMPRLDSWHIYFRFIVKDQNILAAWKKYILRHVQSNWNVRNIDSPFRLEGIKETLLFNSQFYALLHQHDQMSSGIWSKALSRINKNNIDSIYRALREIPALFQQVSDESSQYQLPSFVVPHHIHCPGCKHKHKVHAD